MASGIGGIKGHDHEALSLEQLIQLRNFKIRTRIADEQYLRSHKEVELLLSGFFREMFLKRPVDIQEFAAGETIIFWCLIISGKSYRRFRLIGRIPAIWDLLGILQSRGPFLSQSFP
uniref:RIIa domain-containing protein n=1 Tax=Vombatus ursinus TaxID=29139 RepID=A0A4X2L9W3_VOMUR